MKDGDEVISFRQYIYRFNTINFKNNLIPVPVEPDISTYNIDPDLIEKHITKKTKAILAGSSSRPNRWNGHDNENSE